MILDRSTGQRLGIPAYNEDFSERFKGAGEFWKLERGQVFAEPGSPSWDACAQGDWEESLRLIGELRPAMTGYRREIEARGMLSRRVRVVELPLTPFLHWELRYLLARSEHGGHLTRVVSSADVAHLEAREPLPEVGTLDSSVVYEVIYAADGTADHALRYTDAVLAGHFRDLIARLYEQGEPLSEFFRREIEPLPFPPG